MQEFVHQSSFQPTVQFTWHSSQTKYVQGLLKIMLKFQQGICCSNIFMSHLDAGLLPWGNNCA
jgi:hypothetical protein